MKVVGSYTISPDPFLPEQIDLSEATPIDQEVLDPIALIKRLYEIFQLNIFHLNRVKDEGFLLYAPGLRENLTNVEFNLKLMLKGMWHRPIPGCQYDYEFCVDILNEIREFLEPFNFNPDAIKVCNHPNEINISSTNVCANSHANYDGGAIFTGESSFHDVQFPESDGNCYAGATAIFRVRRSWFSRLSGNKWKHVRKTCNNVIYLPVSDPTPDPPGRWLAPYKDVVSINTGN